MTAYMVYDRSNEVLAYAASELKRHLEMLKPAPMQILQEEGLTEGYAITLRVEPRQDLTHPADDAYEYCVKNDSAQFTGCCARSVLLAVYAYLREIGFRFLSPGEHGTLVPDNVQEQGLFASKTVEKMQLRHRGVCIEGSSSAENLFEFIDWMPKLGYNSFFMQFRNPYTFLARWYRHDGNEFLEKQPFTQEDCDRIDSRATQELARRGMIHHRVGHGWTGEALGRVCVGWDVDNNPLDDETRKLLAMINGERAFWRGVPSNTNLCYANPEVTRRLVSCITDYAQQNPYVDLLHVWLADTANNICECEACTKTTPTDQYVALLNEIDKELSSRGVKTHIVFLLYQELLYAPIYEKLNNPDRFTLMFAPISRTFEQSYPEQIELPALPEYQRNQIELPVGIEQNLAYLKEWQKKFMGDSFVYDYPLGRAHYGDFGYYNIAKVLANDIAVLLKWNLNGYISCQELRALFPNALPNYVMGLMLENPSRTFEEICEEYFAAAYGCQAQQVKEYLSGLSDSSHIDYFNAKGDRVQPQLAPDYERAANRAQEFLEGAQQMIAKSEGVQQHFIKRLYWHAEYVVLLANALKALCSGDNEAANALYDTFHSFICKAEPSIQPFLDVYRVGEVATNYTGFEKSIVQRDKRADCAEYSQGCLDDSFPV